MTADVIAIDRTFDHVLANILNRVTVTGTDCWEYNGYKNEKGYGRATCRTDGGRKTVIVHRFVYECLVGPIDDGLTIDHLCRVRSCCNPDHLEPVTMSENYRRGSRPHGVYCKPGLHLNVPSHRTTSQECGPCKLRARRVRYRAIRDAGYPRTVAHRACGWNDDRIRDELGVEVEGATL